MHCEIGSTQRPLGYSISQEICTRFLLCCALLWLYIDFPISIRLTSLALWQSNDCSSASKATLMDMDKSFMWIHYERLHNHNKAKHNKTVCIFLGIYCTSVHLALLYAWCTVHCEIGCTKWLRRSVHEALTYPSGTWMLPISEWTTTLT